MDTALDAVAIIALALIGLYALQLIVSRARLMSLAEAGARAERERLSAQIGLLLEARGKERERQERSWNGWRKFSVAEKVVELPGLCSFYLKPHDGKPLPPFKPGQYLTFQLNIAGQGKPVIRCYSLSDGPAELGRYRISVKKVLPPPGKPGSPGLSSSYLCDQVRPGDILDVKAPAGHFFLDLTRSTPVVLIGGGIGITPVLSMLNAIIASGSRRETWFFLGVRNRAEHVMKEHLERAAREHDYVRLQVCYSDPGPEDVPRRDYQHGERVSVELFKRTLPSSNYEYYLCGPGPMMNSITAGLKAWGVPDSSVFYESFGAASVKSVAPGAAAAGPAARVSFVRSGKTCAWTPGTASVLDLAAANGVAIESGCRAGNCGTCVVAIKSGEVKYAAAPGFAVEKGSCLACIATPAGDLALDA